MLIIVAVLVFYNEYNKTMNIAEIGLLIVALIAIVRASMNYITLNDTAKWEWEGFTSSRKSGIKSKGNNRMEDVMVLDSSRSKEYFDTDKDTDIDTDTDESRTKTTTPQTTQHILTSLSGNKVDTDAVSQVNSLLGISTPGKSTSKFTDVSDAASNSGNTNTNSGIDSVFVPQIQIGKGAQDRLYTNTNIDVGINLQGMNMTNLGGLGVPNISSLASTAAAVGAGDNMTFPNTMKPSGNLWGADMEYMDNSINWSQSLNDYNNGKWNPKLYSKPSDYIDYYTPNAFGMNTPPNTSGLGIAEPAPTLTPTPTSASNSSSGSSISASAFEDIPRTTNSATAQTTLDLNGQPKKLCGAYDDLSLEQSGNLVVKNYTQAKKWMPGYTYIPPVYWNVPQKHVGACQAANPNARKLTGLMDRGTPINALELNPDGTQATTEDTVSLTNVGSIIPSFSYHEQPFSKPYA